MSKKCVIGFRVTSPSVHNRMYQFQKRFLEIVPEAEGSQIPISELHMVLVSFCVTEEDITTVGNAMAKLGQDLEYREMRMNMTFTTIATQDRKVIYATVPEMPSYALRKIHERLCLALVGIKGVTNLKKGDFQAHMTIFDTNRIPRKEHRGMTIPSSLFPVEETDTGILKTLGTFGQSRFCRLQFLAADDSTEKIGPDAYFWTTENPGLEEGTEPWLNMHSLCCYGKK